MSNKHEVMVKIQKNLRVALIQVCTFLNICLFILIDFVPFNKTDTNFSCVSFELIQYQLAHESCLWLSQCCIRNTSGLTGWIHHHPFHPRHLSVCYCLIVFSPFPFSLSLSLSLSLSRSLRLAWWGLYILRNFIYWDRQNFEKESIKV